MSEADTKAPVQGGEDAGDNNPAAKPEPSTAAPAETTAPAASQEETVTVKKSDYDAMIGRQKSLDKKEKRLEKLGKRVGDSGHFGGQPQPKEEAPAASPAAGERHPEDVKAERGLMKLAVSPKYREVLDADPTLRDLLLNNPLAVLPLYAEDALDAEDAVELLEEMLDERKAAVKPATPVAKPEEKPQTPVVPPAGQFSPGVSVGTEVLEDPTYKEAIKPGTAAAIAEGIKQRMSRTHRR